MRHCKISEDHELAAGASETTAWVRSRDWSQSSLGPIEQWPETLRNTVTITLEMTVPAMVCWGERLTMIPNNPWRHSFNHTPDVSRASFRATQAKFAEMIRPLAERALAGEMNSTATLPIQITRKGRQVEAWFEWCCSPLRDASGGVAGFLAIAVEMRSAGLKDRQSSLGNGPNGHHDISWRKQTEAALRDSEERYRTLFHSLDEGFCVLEMLFDDSNRPIDYRFIETNSTFEEQTGLRDPVGRTARELVPNLDESWFQLYGNVALTGRATRFENHAPAMHRWFSVYAFPIGPKESHQVALLFSDITSRKNNEKELYQFNRSLEQRVAERTAELEGQTARLRHLASELASAEQRERKRLAALLHDDLQQLLVAANMQIGILARTIKDTNQAEVISRAGQWLDEAVNAARDLTRQLRPPALYEDGLLAALHWLASEMRNKHGLEVAIDAVNIGQTLSDDVRALLFDCIRELLFNITKYAEVDRATMRVWEQEECLRLVVTDNGKGFHVASILRNRQSEGFGLFSIRERLAALGGDITIESSPGQGTTVEMEVPLSEATGIPSTSSLPPFLPAKIQKNNRSVAPTDHRSRVLVVDDHAMVREGIATIISNDERLLVIGQASDGFAAIEAMEQHQPDVVLVDVNMPRMNGIEATREIHRRNPLTIIVGLSVQDDDATAKSMIDAGAAAFLSKTGDSDKMIATILNLIQHKNAG